jgi:transcriptional regulator with XRE-family HTH domain
LQRPPSPRTSADRRQPTGRSRAGGRGAPARPASGQSKDRAAPDELPFLEQDRGASERYPAQLESGQANLSVRVLRQIARALNLPAAELLRDEDERSVERTLIEPPLRRLPPGKLVGVRAQLRREQGRNYRAREKRVALIGLRGAGKSTLGTALARTISVSFMELDRDVEAEAGTSLHAIFLLHGQAQGTATTNAARSSARSGRTRPAGSRPEGALWPSQPTAISCSPPASPCG